MSSCNTKHKPRTELPDLKKRAVPIPVRVGKEMVEGGGSVVLGCREPEEGRYDTLSRQTYRNSTTPQLHDEISKEHRERAEYMRNRHFYLDENPQLLLSEIRGTTLEPSEEMLRAARHDTRANMLLMTSSSIFVADNAVDDWKKSNSTVRADFVPPSKELLEGSRGKTREFRKLQQGTHFVLGSSTEVPNSENRACFRGETTEKVQKSRVNMVSTINIGSPDVPTAETLRSLKQVDFVDHHLPRNSQGARNNLQKHNMVLGYQPKNLVSLYGASYTPTEFVQEEQPKSPHRKPRF
jgi:hypothetical protein